MIRLSAEVKTGIMVITCFLILCWLLFKTGDITFFARDDGYNIKVVFNFAAGIEENAPVRLAGVEVGKVKEITLEYEPQTRAILTVWLNSRAKVREDSQAYINTLGLMGEKYLEISSGRSDRFLKDGDVLIGEDPFQMERLIKKGEAIAEKLDATLVSVKSLAENVNGLVSENRPGINEIVANLEEATANFKDFSEDIKRHPWKLLLKGRERRRKRRD